ncbi:MAG: PAS domain-containing protein [Desulfarculus sp.]|nr:PAS domain-containing protein [Desulfarculus sp.]
MARTFDKMADSLVHQMEAMAHAHDRQEAILRGMVEGVMLTDFEGRILLANQSLVSLLGLQTDPVGRIYSEVLRIPDLTSAMEDILEGQPRVSAEIRSLGPPLRYLEAHLVRLEGRGPQAGAVAVFHDITERRHIDQMRRDFVANTSHELRTPLAAIKGAAETLLDGALDSPQHARGFVEMIVRQSRRMERLGEDLLSLASLENAEVAPKREAVKARQVVAAVLATAGPLAQQRGIHLEAPEPAQDYSLMADGRQLEQALLNLVDNAIKYNNPGGKVTIAFNALEGQLRLSVRDTGPGIPSEHLPRIFERFYRVDKNRSREQGGTGLGLAIVKHVAQAHGGRVEVESKVGRGSEFRLILPLKSGERS